MRNDGTAMQVDNARVYFDRLYQRRQQRQGGNDTATHYEHNPIWQHYVQALRHWIATQDLQHKRVLEIGCGLGLLQDLVDDYVGMDIARAAGNYVHKPFLSASATVLPFADNSFDGIWSIWVLEHIAQPEQMLQEIERVLKPGGVLFLCAAWDVPTWTAQGYHVRPFRSLTWQERLIKMTVMPRATRPYRQVATLLRRGARLLRAAGVERPLPLAYRRLTPNFDTYWSSDADACTAIDSHAVWLWFTQRNHQSLDETSKLRSLFLRHNEPLRVRKAERAL
jgi:ubiquinone/menaquinone biosynthesis C-methylase UbiE